jgi:transcriptional repressor NrdR
VPAGQIQIRNTVQSEVTAVHCPYCRNDESRVLDSRLAEDGSAIRRRRSCPSCGKRFTTVEVATLVVVKRGGATEQFSRAKVVAGVRKACQGRPVDDTQLANLAQTVEETIRGNGAAEVASDDVGLAILAPLRELDEVAYLRFASVYRAFDSLSDFQAEIDLLRLERDLADAPAVPEAPTDVHPPSSTDTSTDTSSRTSPIQAPPAPKDRT